jgi:hypothetical protein
MTATAQAVNMSFLLMGVLGCTVAVVISTRIKRFGRLLILIRSLRVAYNEDKNPAESHRIQHMKREFEFELKRLPIWLVPQLDTYSHGTFGSSVLRMLRMARGQILMAFIGSCMVYVGLALFDKEYILYHALGILLTVLGVQSVVGAVREGALCEPEASAVTIELFEPGAAENGSSVENMVAPVTRRSGTDVKVEHNAASTVAR